MTIPVEKYMSRAPVTVAPEVPLAQARALMGEHRIRHLPVVNGEARLVGLLSLTDVHLIESLPDVPRSSIAVDNAMTREPFAVQAGTPLAEVVQQMAERKIGSAIVLEGGAVAGVLTAIDAARALIDALREK